MQEESQKSIDQIRKLINEDGGEDKAVFIRAKQGMERYNMSRPEFIKLAVEAGAAYKINSMILVDKAAFEKYLETFRIPAQVL